LLNLGDRPEKLLITEISVPPVPIRPSVFVGGANRGRRFVLWFLKTSYNGVSA
jgi:DNA-directed RNA polymerase beta' subunit